ncbi:MAG: SCO family protein [Rhodocyclales bacterium]|nr:SCO family protein [Rhodocyclales bacterium]
MGLALALSGAFLAWRHWPAPVPALPPAGHLPSATLVNDTAPLPAFALHHANGKLTNADLLGHWTLLSFGYTFCPDICPTTLATLNEVKAQLAARGTPVPQVMFVSVDPARDTPQRLAEYVRFFDPAFIGATGSDAELAGLVKHLGVHYQRHEGPDRQHYVVDHSAVVYLIDPQARLKAVFTWPHDPATMATDYAQLTSGRPASP